VVFALGTVEEEARARRHLPERCGVGVGFVRNQIIMQTMGPTARATCRTSRRCSSSSSSATSPRSSRRAVPANARFAMPMTLALVTWVIFNVVGVVKQGRGHYLKNSSVPPACRSYPAAARDPIEFVSTFIVRPFSLMVDSSPTCSPVTSSSSTFARSPRRCWR
jgi:hypothetical protein